MEKLQWIKDHKGIVIIGFLGALFLVGLGATLVK